MTFLFLAISLFAHAAESPRQDLEAHCWSRAEENIACQKLGFRYSTGFDLDHVKKETLFVRLSTSEEPMTWRGQGPYIRHLLCQ